MRAPLWFIYGNCVFGEGSDDGWAAFKVDLASYAWLSEERKRGCLLELVGALETIEADIQLLRVSRSSDPSYEATELASASPPGQLAGNSHEAVRSSYVQKQVRRLQEIDCAEPVLFLLVSLREPDRDVASYVSKAMGQQPREWWQNLRRSLSLGDRRLLSEADLERTRVRADQAHARVAEYLSVRPAHGVELQWLVRRCFCRALGEPLVDGLHEPRALAFERNGRAMLAPLEGDVMRWADGYVEHRGRMLRVESELGTSWQAQLVLGALPERIHFPGVRAELML